MSDYVIVQANAGLSGNFLMRLLNFSRAIEWTEGSIRHEDIVSKTADNQFINYCWTSQCHKSVSSTTHRLGHHWYREVRGNVLDASTWLAIKQASVRPSAWFFHSVSPEVLADIDTIIVQIDPGKDFDIQMLLDRYYFNGPPEDFNELYGTANQWFEHVLNQVYTSCTLKLDKADIVIKNKDIFDTVKVLELMKELDLYHSGLRELVSDWIKVYTLKNTRPQGLFSKSPPDEYNYAEQVNCIQDPYIRHMMKCVNRGPWPTLDLMDDPYSYVIDFRKNLLAGNSTATQCFDFATQQFKHWQNSLLP